MRAVRFVVNGNVWLGLPSGDLAPQVKQKIFDVAETPAKRLILNGLLEFASFARWQLTGKFAWSASENRVEFRQDSKCLASG